MGQGGKFQPNTPLYRKQSSSMRAVDEEERENAVALQFWRVHVV